MNPRTRPMLFLISAAGLVVVFVWGLSDLPPMGDYRGPYGYVVTEVAVYERHATDVVNAINYDYRAFDTLGEEFILFASVLGVLLLFRPSDAGGKKRQSQKNNDLAEEGLPVSDALRASTQAVMGVMVVFGVYLATHGQLTPGGGFQGGVVLASTPILVYLAGDVEAFEKITDSILIKISECGGAAGYGIIGILALLYGAHFLTNVVPLGTTGDLFSSGNIAIISVCVGVEVTGGFVQLTQIYLREIVEARLQGKS
jgi:multicomponent Na+:H+ antiporter subunit B